MRVLGGGAFGRELGREGGTYLNVFLALRRREGRTSREAIGNQEEGRASHRDLAGSQSFQRCERYVFAAEAPSLCGFLLQPKVDQLIKTALLFLPI